jgi:hypothetical protein
VTVRADWHTPALEGDGGDPFATPERIERVGTPIDLRATDDRAELTTALQQTIAREARLADEGVTCAIKDVADASCHACPLFRADGSAMSRLCALGREQESLSTRIAVTFHGR